MIKIDNNIDSFEDKFKRVLALHAQEQTGAEVSEVLSFREQKGWIGADDTYGGQETTEVSVKFINGVGTEKETVLYGSIGELVQALFSTAKRHGIS